MSRKLGVISTVLLSSQLLAIVVQGAARNDHTNALTQCKDRPDYKGNTDFGLYKFHHEPRTWNEARKVCAYEGAHLAILNSPEEEEALRKLFKRNSGSVNSHDADNIRLAWLGYHDYFKEGDWTTVLGQPEDLTGYNPWNKDYCYSPKTQQPDNTRRYSDGAIQDCGALIRHCEGIDDNWCDEKLAFICECPV